MLSVKKHLQTKIKTFVVLISLLFTVSACNLFNQQADTETKEKAQEHKKQQKEQVTQKKKPETAKPEGKVLYTIDFAQDSKENAREWLKKNNFEFQSDAKSQSDLALSFADKSLVLDAKTKLFGLIINGKLHVENANFIRITWGVTKYPNGASYAKGVNNEPIMVYVYFGDKKLSSGSMFIPDAPYFLGLYLGENDPVNKPFIGRHFKKGGRFICLANPKPGETITTEFNLDKGFKECFGKDKALPFISALALEVETSSTGPSTGFIKKIEFVK